MKTIEEKEKKPFPEKRKKNSYIRARVNQAQYEQVTAIARLCGMDKLARFILTRSFGLEPRLALTDEETACLGILNYCIVDMENFEAAFKRMSKEARAFVEQHVPNIGLWLKDNKVTATKCRKFYNQAIADDYVQSWDLLTVKTHVPGVNPKDYFRPTSGDLDFEIKAKVTRHQKAQIVATAVMNGVDESAIVRSRCLNHTPQHRLTEEQMQDLRQLGEYRSDIIPLSSYISKLSYAQKEQLFNDGINMLKWLMAINRVVEGCKQFIRTHVNKKV